MPWVPQLSWGQGKTFILVKPRNNTVTLSDLKLAEYDGRSQSTLPVCRNGQRRLLLEG